MTVPVVFKSYKEGTPNKGYWDYALLISIISKELWWPVNDIAMQIMDDLPERGEYEGVILVVPARYHADYVDAINIDIAKFKWCIVILMGDEDGSFPVLKLNHPRAKVYLMLPHFGDNKYVDRYIPNGWPVDTRQILSSYKKEAYDRPLDWFFAGQVTHVRRRKCAESLRSMQGGELIETPGFTLGIPREQYLRKMASAKIVPCPSGAVIPDSFRLYEALEAGCLPIVDGKAPLNEVKNYWHFLFGFENSPFPIIDNWKDLPGLIQYHIDTWPKGANKAFAWWQKQKRQMVYDLQEDLEYLSGKKMETTDLKDKITVLIPTSYIPSHPDTSIIQETISTIRQRLPNSEIIIMCDGIRDEQMENESKYQEYLRRLLWLCNYEYKNILPLVFETHTHQVGMTREALKYVKTPTILFVEHDTPLCEEIPLDTLVGVVTAGEANMIRLHHEALILDVHKHLMLDDTRITVHGLPMVRTGQWSQRPHIASTEFYKHILSAYFSANSISMIEDGIIGKVQQALLERGRVGWNEFKVMIYAPEGDMKRSYHLDGRQHESKFENTFQF